MSVINKKPFIVSLLESLTSEEAEQLKTLIDGGGAPAVYRSLLINSGARLSAADKGIKRMQLEVSLTAAQGMYEGYMVYTDTYCVLIAYSAINNPRLTLIDVDMTSAGEPSYTLRGCDLTILELRSELDDATDDEALAGKADLVGGKVPASQLPSYVDDVVEGYLYDGAFYEEAGHTTLITPETGKIYVDLVTGYTYRYSGSVYVQIGGQDLSNYQEKLVSGTNIKTINNISVLGSGNIDTNELPATLGTAGQVLKVNASATGVEWGSAGGGSTPDSDVTVEIESNYSSTDYANRTNYATAISLQEWIANCEAGNVYTNAGIIAKVNNLISGKAFRLILIGTNHEVLVYDDTTQAKTTWQFLDMPEHDVPLGLPINVLDMGGTDSRARLNAFLDGTNANSITVKPSNMDGLIAAQGLLQVNETIYDELPETLQRHIKIVRRYYYRKRNSMTIEASTEGNPGAISNTGHMFQLAQTIFHLAGTDLGTSGQSGEGSGSLYTYLNTAAARIRFYNGTAANYWNASPNTSGAHYWYGIDDEGSENDSDTRSDYGVAPAFCI